MALVQIKNLSKFYHPANKGEVAALRSVTLEVEDGELLVVLGPSGSGKTTLLRIIAGLEADFEGTISIDGTIVNDRPPQDRDVSMVFQEHTLYPHMSVHENLAFGLKLRKVGRSESEMRVQEVAELVGLKALLSRPPTALSGGERQRVALGRALVLKPRLLLLDEPLSNLDAPLRAQMRREIAALHRRLRGTMIYVTHDQVEAMSLADRIVVLKEGAIQQIGPPLEIYQRPANLFVATFIGMPPMNLFSGTLIEKDGTTRFDADPHTGLEGSSAVAFCSALGPSGRILHGTKVLMGLRAEDLRVLSSDERCGASEVVLRGSVETVEPLGWETHVWLTAGSGRFVTRLQAHSAPKPGDSIQVSLAPGNALWFEESSGNRLLAQSVR